MMEAIRHDAMRMSSERGQLRALVQTYHVQKSPRNIRSEVVVLTGDLRLLMHEAQIIRCHVERVERL